MNMERSKLTTTPYKLQCTKVSINPCMHACVHAYVRTCVRACVRTYVHNHIQPNIIGYNERTDVRSNTFSNRSMPRHIPEPS